MLAEHMCMHVICMHACNYPTCSCHSCMAKCMYLLFGGLLYACYVHENILNQCMLYETYMYINIASDMQTTCLLGSSCRSMIISCNIRYMQQIRVGNLLSLHHHSELTQHILQEQNLCVTTHKFKLIDDTLQMCIQITINLNTVPHLRCIFDY